LFSGVVLVVVLGGWGGGCMGAERDALRRYRLVPIVERRIGTTVRIQIARI